MRTRLVRRLEHALFPRLRLGTEEFQPVEEPPGAIEPGRGGFAIACVHGFFRPWRAANLLGGGAESIFGRRVELRVVLSGGVGFARSRRRRLRRRRQRPIEDRIGARRCPRQPRSARALLRRSGRTVLRRRRRRTDVAPRRGGRRLDLVPSARLGGTSLGRAEFGWLVPLAGLADLGRRHLARGFHELTRRFSLYLADRLLEREALAGDVGLLERRRHSA